MSDQNKSEKPEKGTKPSVDARDIMCIVGVGLVGYGAWLVYPAAGFIAPGVILTAVAIFGVRS
ncbi:hypothetical protein [Sulfitobacter sp. M22]|uniref:hypothetical protein n=1 Tax=Sulfitobacter sp. M22 TaxID=2675332 RepID=UPI001F47F7DA|nr:hypothetical protein [Sulfitobacter sp. M22]MCF7725768.1 hypothetical protein [Sulfitobacter sp. M22]